MTSLVSILIPAYNAERWIARTLESAIAQIWPCKEIIVVDDGSTDRTLSVARQLESKTVQVITQPNQGAAAARNHALALSRGDYIQWLDADDLLSPGKIAKQMDVAMQVSEKRALFSSAWAYFRNRPGRAKFIPTPLWCDLDPTEWLTRKWEGNWHMQTATWLVSRELTEAVGPWDSRLWVDDDGEYFARVVNASNGIKFVPDSKVYYRITSSNSLSYIGRSQKKMEAQFLSMRLQIGYLRAREDSRRVREACVKYLQTWLPSIYPECPDLVREAELIAASLEGQLSLPKASWKYAWIEKVFGFAAAKRAQMYYNRVKGDALGIWDKMMCSCDRRSLSLR
jgi:glycosyltransferase involved in cell wall biosynthesis